MEGDMPPALEVALEYIVLNNLIKERRTLLAGRLVCRTWRNSKTLSSKITDLTLHTLADVKLAADFFPRVPRQRAPWRSVEDSQVFPNLSLLKVSGSLVPELCSCSASRELLANIGNVGVEVTLGNSHEWDSDYVAKFETLSGVASSVKLGPRVTSQMLNSMFSDASLAAVSGRLTSLKVTRGSLSSPHILRAISQLSSLRHLELDDFIIRNDTELATCFSTCASLSQLTRLDITGPTLFTGDIATLSHLVNAHAPSILHDFKFLYAPREEGNPELESCQLQASFLRGVLQTDHCECAITLESPQDLDRVVSHELSKGSQSRAVLADVRVDCALSKLPLDLTQVASVQDLDVLVNYFPEEIEGDSDSNDENMYAYEEEPEEEDEEEEEKTNASDEDGDNCPQNGMTNESISDDGIRPLPRDCITPILMSQQGVQMAASKLEFQVECMCAIDLSNMMQELPCLFPQLQNLQLQSCNSGVCKYPQDISQLTKLTHLTMAMNCLNFFNPKFCVPTYLPTSLRELLIHADIQKLPVLEDLEHLTKLSICIPQVMHRSSIWNPVFSCRAPLRELCLGGGTFSQFSLPTLVAAFPDLDTLEVNPDSFDVSPLSSLRLLQTLTVHLPKSDTAFLTGAETLTGLASLSVKNASECHEGLSNLSSLTQLRHLQYNFHKFLHGMHEKRYDTELQLRRRLPHTTIQLSAESCEII